MRQSARFRQGFTQFGAFRLAAGVAFVVVIVAGLAVASRGLTASSRVESPVPAGFAREVGRHRLTGARLSVSRSHARCAARVPPGGTIPRTACPAPPPALATSKAVRSAVGPAGTDPLAPARYAAALADILWADGGGISLDRSVSFLESAARLAEKPAVVLADLAGAYLERAEVRQAPEDLFRALDAASRAVEMAPDNAVACFNRALALEYVGADRNAATAWETCAVIDGDSGWGDEARRRAGERRAAIRIQPPPRPSPGSPAADVDAFVAAEPEAARVYGWGEVLGAWGGAVLRGDSAGARRNLVLADAIAGALARRGGDRTLLDALAVIRASARTGDARRLAQGHAVYARGLRAYDDVDHTAARPFLAELRVLRPPSGPLLAWTRRLEGLVLLTEGNYAGVETLLAAAEADTLRHPALAASLHQTRGTALLRDGRFQQARDAWTLALRFFLRAGEKENAGGTRYLQADAEFLLGAPEAHATIHRALGELRTFRRSRWLHTAFMVLAVELAGEGLPHAALAASDEGLEVARATGRPMYEAEMRLQRAQLLVALGRRREAEAEIASAARVVRELEGERRRWFQGDLYAARAMLLLRDDPRRAAAEMDSLLAVPGAARTEPRVLLGLLGRAQARLAAGDAGRATADLDSATVLLAEQGGAVTTLLLRSSILDAAKATFDQLVMLQLARGDTLGALRTLERGRVSLAQGRGAAAGGERWSLPAGTAALDYALVGDTLLAWAVTPQAVRLHRRTTDRASLLRRVERLRTAMELRAPDAELRPLLAGVYDELVKPVRAALPEPARLAVVSDGELGDVPFAALYDAGAGRYLLESYTVLTVSSLRDVHGAPARPTAARRPALVVSDPAFDGAAHPGLSRLPGAAAEADAVAHLYPDTVRLRAAGADVRAVTARLPRAAVFHFAGHAVFDDERPDRSFLLLAPAPDDAGGGRLPAALLGGLDLRALDLVVLSSCETLRSPARRSGGFAGLAGALLGAGVDGVVGSPWRVDDGLTRSLMTDFHQAYRDTGDGPESLRAAQLRALRGGDLALRTPAVWAAFRYAGN
jgi:CHAT domain-containing protein/tetratricopeptide (TPR) repeat protein